METNSLTFFEVGGCVRDDFLGIPSKDIDFTVVGAASFQDMVAALASMGFIILKENEPTFTAVCKVPASMPELLARTKVADFVMARKESSERIGRIPVSIEPGTLEDDLARRDFTVNAIARVPATGELIDPHGGLDDLKGQGTLRFVGDPFQRIEEDALRIVRAFRFLVMKGFDCDIDTWDALCSSRAADLLNEVDEDGKRVISVDRFHGEWTRTFLFDTPGTLALLADVPDFTRRALFPPGLRLKATMEGGQIVQVGA